MSRGGFGVATLRGALPMLLWAVHFSASYVGVAVGCTAGWQRTTLLGMPALLTGLAGVTVLALVAAAMLLWRACRASQGSRALLPAVRALVALLALVGIAWTSVPMWVLPLCRYN